MERIYAVVFDNYEWESSTTKMFSSLQKAIEYANMYGTFKNEDMCRRFDNDEGFDEQNWRKGKHVTVKYEECKGKRMVYIEELKIDNFGGIENI